jgi:hypothetical protein
MNITRIDVEQTPGGLLVREWFEGWNQDATPPCDLSRTVNKNIGLFMLDLQDAGYTCEMADGTHGRALRGEITRIDFYKQADGWRVQKYPYGWTAKTRPIQEAVLADTADALRWCKDNGWVVREWPGGARAFKGKPYPVRDTAGIMSMRRKAEAEYLGGQTGTNKIFFDFAFDW